MQSSPLLSLSPSFNSYSSGKLAEIAARVVQEFREETDSEFDDIFCFRNEGKPEGEIDEQPQVEEERETNNSEEGDYDDDDFEFPFLRGEPTSPISADDVFCNGQIRPVYPVFNRHMLFGDVVVGNGELNSSKAPVPSPVRLPLGKLLNEDRDPPSCSSSEADELDGVAAGTYCVWTPKVSETAAAESPGRCKKSNSTGSSKRWKFRDLVHRSNSDGKDTFVFLSPSGGNSTKKADKASDKPITAEKDFTEVKLGGKVKSKGAGAGEAHYVRNRVAVNEGDRRRSFLPYRQDLVGFFANMNGLSRNLHPF